MKKSARILAVLAAAATLGLGLSSCDYWDTEWYKNGGDTSTASSGGSGSGSSGSTASSGSAAYSGNLTVNSVAYTTLTMTGDASSGTAVLSGNGGSANGTYARSAVAAAANTLNLSGTYTLTFSFGTITVVFANNTVTISAGTVAASGTASVSTESGTASTGSSTTTNSSPVSISEIYGKTFTSDCSDSVRITSTGEIVWTVASVLPGGTPDERTSTYTATGNTFSADFTLQDSSTMHAEWTIVSATRLSRTSAGYTGYYDLQQ